MAELHRLEPSALFHRFSTKRGEFPRFFPSSSCRFERARAKRERERDVIASFNEETDGAES